MRSFLITLGALAYAAAVLMFVTAHGSVVIEIESFIAFASGTIAFTGVGVIGAITNLRDDTVRLSNIERIEAKQRELAKTP